MVKSDVYIAIYCSIAAIVFAILLTVILTNIFLNRFNDKKSSSSRYQFAVSDEGTIKHSREDTSKNLTEIVENRTVYDHDVHTEYDLSPRDEDMDKMETPEISPRGGYRRIDDDMNNNSGLESFTLIISICCIGGLF